MLICWFCKAVFLLTLLNGENTTHEKPASAGQQRFNDGCCEAKKAQLMSQFNECEDCYRMWRAFDKARKAFLVDFPLFPRTKQIASAAA